MKRPRDYQTEAHNALIEFIHAPENYGRNPLVVEATGLGKSLNIAMFIWHMLSMYPRLRMIQLTHVKELVKGNYQELLGMWPSAPAGVYAAGLGEKNSRAPITFAMINSVFRRAATFGKIDFAIIDEAHRLSKNDDAMYARFLADLRAKNPNLIVVGYTATPYRMGQGHLTEEGGLFDEVVYDIGSGESFVRAVNDGYLIRPVPIDPGFQLDDSALEISAGDFKTADASQALRDQHIIERAVDYSCAVAEEQGRRCNLVFAQSIDDAEMIADMYRYKGYAVEAVHSKRNDRDEVLSAFGRGDLWGVVNKDVMTTGSNFPRIDLLTVLRVTRSPGLWVQMVGRATRPSWAPGYDITTLEGRQASILASHKQNALVLDFVGNTERLGPINYPNLPRRRGAAGGDPPVRKCPQCQPTTLHHVSVKICPHCGYEWPVEPKVRGVASNSDLVIDLSKQPVEQIEVFPVHEMVAAHHQGRGDKPDTMRVRYRSFVDRYSTWVCLNHPEASFPQRKASEWWRQHGGQEPVPSSVEEGIRRADELNKPRFIKVRVSGKYPEIIAYDFIGTRFEIDLTPGAEQKIYEVPEDPMKKVNERNQEINRLYAEDFEVPF